MEINFNSQKQANQLIAAGLIGALLTFIYYYINTHISFEGTPDPVLSSSNQVIFIYYLINSTFLFFAGLALRHRMKVGLILFTLAVISILLSLFFPPGLGIVEAEGYSGPNLFFYTILLAITGSFIVPLIPGVGTALFLWFVFINALDYKRWINFLES